MAVAGVNLKSKEVSPLEEDRRAEMARILDAIRGISGTGGQLNLGYETSTKDACSAPKPKSRSSKPPGISSTENEGSFLQNARNGGVGKSNNNLSSEFQSPSSVMMRAKTIVSNKRVEATNGAGDLNSVTSDSGLENIATGDEVGNLIANQSARPEKKALSEKVGSGVNPTNSKAKEIRRHAAQKIVEQKTEKIAHAEIRENFEMATQGDASLPTKSKEASPIEKNGELGIEYQLLKQALEKVAGLEEKLESTRKTNKDDILKVQVSLNEDMLRFQASVNKKMSATLEEYAKKFSEVQTLAQDAVKEAKAAAGRSDHLVQIVDKLVHRTKDNGEILWALSKEYRNTASKLALECSGHLWIIRGVQDAWRMAVKKGSLVESVPFYTAKYNGYKMQATAYLNGAGDATGEFMSLSWRLLPTDRDEFLPWPFKDTVKFKLMPNNKAFPDALPLIKETNVDVELPAFQRPLDPEGPEPSADRYHGVTKFVKLVDLGKYISDDTMTIEISVVPVVDLQ